MFFGSFPKLMILLVLLFFLCGVPLMSYVVTIYERRKKRLQERERQGDGRR